MYIVFNIRHFGGDPNDYNHQQISQLTTSLEELCLDYNIGNMNITLTKDDNVRVEFEKPSDYTLWSLAWSRYVKRMQFHTMGHVLYTDQDY
jgi:hypothetical protein